MNVGLYNNVIYSDEISQRLNRSSLSVSFFNMSVCIHLCVHGTQENSSKTTSMNTYSQLWLGGMM